MSSTRPAASRCIWASRRFYPIQVAEKGFVTIKMTVSGTPGHGSMPRADTRYRVDRRFDRTHHAHADAAPRHALDAPDACRSRHRLRQGAAAVSPMLSNTVTPTILRAGYKDNVHPPARAWVILDGRTLPGGGRAQLHPRTARYRGGPSRCSKSSKPRRRSRRVPTPPLFDLIKSRTEAADPGAPRNSVDVAGRYR